MAAAAEVIAMGDMQDAGYSGAITCPLAEDVSIDKLRH